MAVDIVSLHQELAQEATEIAELLQHELDEGGEMTKARENNYRLLQLVLEQPELHPRDYDSILYDKFGIDRSSEIHSQLRISNIYSPDRRQRLVRIMKDISGKTYSLLVGESVDVARDFDVIARIVRSKDFYNRRIEGKSFLIALVSLPLWIKKDQSPYLRSSLDVLEAVGRKGSYKLCRETVRRLVDMLGTKYGFEKRKTSTERVQDILEDVAFTRDVEDMRATLLIMQRESQHLKEQFEGEVENRNQEFVRDFFVRMNSVRYGELLDSIAQTDALIQKLQQQGWKMEPELQAIPMIIQVFVNFLRTEGVVPIENVGEVQELHGAQLSNYEFLGTSSVKPEDRIKVIVRTPGWKFGDTVISRPRVETLPA